MPNQTPLESVIVDPAQQWIERVSGLEEEIRNLRRLHLTIERNNTLFEALLASSRDGITLTRLDGTIIRAVRPILGYEVSELPGTPIYKLLHAEDCEALRAAYRRLGDREQGQIELELRLHRPDGSFAWVQCTLTDMLDNPAVLAIVINYRNVTRLKTSEFAAAEFEAVIRRAPFAVFSKNMDGEILSWNERAKDLFGYERDEIVGRHISTLVPPELREEEQRHRSLAIERKMATPKIRTKGLRKDGTHFPLELVLSPIVTGGCVRGIAQLSYPLSCGSVT
jgi:PAS domain S-box-containing protein